MTNIDLIVLLVTLGLIVGYGVWRTRGRNTLDSYLLGGNEAKWWTVGLSVMATQASAITFLSTPGQAFNDGMGFVQFYFGLPLAMIFICIFFIPIYKRLKVYTAYELLESRFNLRTRQLTAFFFLVQRGLAAGITIYAPAIILSTILHWDLTYTNLIIGMLVIIYTMSGGTQAVSITQKQQMFVIMAGMFIAFFLILSYMPEQVGFQDAISLAGASGKMNVIDLNLDWDSRYTLWSGLTGGFFLALSYFGTDQSQVQRYISSRSIKESRLGLMFNALLKIPMQFFILLVGVLVFVFYLFTLPPLFFNDAARENVKETVYEQDMLDLENQHAEIFELRKSASLAFVEASKTEKPILAQEIQGYNQKVRDLREEAKTIISKAAPQAETNDKDYVFINFILDFLPTGIIGLLLAVIFSAAMSSTAAELNALAATTVVDFYRRSWVKDRSSQHYVLASRFFTVVWGGIAIIFATFGSLFENLIQYVNIVGSLFYGTVLGVFLLAFFFKQVRGNSVFFAAILGEIIVWGVYALTPIGYLWWNLIGCGVTIALALIINMFLPAGNPKLAED